MPPILSVKVVLFIIVGSWAKFVRYFKTYLNFRAKNFEVKLVHFCIKSKYSSLNFRAKKAKLYILSIFHYVLFSVDHYFSNLNFRAKIFV